MIAAGDCMFVKAEALRGAAATLDSGFLSRCSCASPEVKRSPPTSPSCAPLLTILAIPPMTVLNPHDSGKLNLQSVIASRAPFKQALLRASKANQIMPPLLALRSSLHSLSWLGRGRGCTVAGPGPPATGLARFCRRSKQDTTHIPPPPVPAPAPQGMCSSRIQRKGLDRDPPASSLVLVKIRLPGQLFSVTLDLGARASSLPLTFYTLSNIDVSL